MPNIVRIARFDVNLSRVLGEGGFGKVYRAKDTSKDPPMECAAKQMSSMRMSEDELKKEVGVMRKVGNHPSIIGFLHFEQVAEHSTPEVRDSAWIFMELATGGELFDRLIDSGNLTERAVAPYFKGMVEGLLHCHRRGVVHRDIKLENVMLSADDPRAVKLVDFGLAVCMPSTPDGGFDEGALLHDKVGSKSYRAPEILASGGYRPTPVDVWALGITVFSLVSGFFPLDEAKPTDWRFARLAHDQARGVGPCASIYAMYRRQCPLSAELAELLDAMLAIDPAARVTLQQVAEHRWFDSRHSAQGEAAEAEDGDEVVYRSAGGQGDEHPDADEDADAPPFELPEMAVAISRQRACLGDTLA